MAMNKNQFIEQAEQTESTLIDSLAEALLTLDELGLSMAAIKVAEAIDILKSGSGHSQTNFVNYSRQSIT